MKQESDSSSIVIGVAWYRRDQWQRLLEIAEDADELSETYESWLSEAEKAIRLMAAENVFLEKVDVDVEEILAWCNARDLPVDSKARSNYVVEKMRDHSR